MAGLYVLEPDDRGVGFGIAPAHRPLDESAGSPEDSSSSGSAGFQTSTEP